MRLRSLVPSIAICLGVTAPAMAHADEPTWFVSPGYVYAVVRGDSPATAHGFELSGHVLLPDVPIGLGVFGQIQRYSGDHDRFAAGAQVTYAIFGLELGYAHRDPGAGPSAAIGPLQETTTHRSQTSGIHLAPFLSLGFVYVAYRWTLPVSTGPAPTHGAEHALTVGVKLPIPVSGKNPLEGMSSFGLWH